MKPAVQPQIRALNLRQMSNHFGAQTIVSNSAANLCQKTWYSLVFFTYKVVFPPTKGT